jgi:hypothetical protein
MFSCTIITFYYYKDFEGVECMSESVAPTESND